VEGLVAILAAARACAGEIINIGSDREETTARGIEIVEGLLGKQARISRRPRRPGDQERTCANIGKARRLLGYEPRTTLEEGLAAEVAWFLGGLSAGR